MTMHLERRRGEDPRARLADALVDRVEVEGHVEDAEDGLAVGVRVARGGGAGGLVVDRRDHREPPSSVRRR